MRRLPINANELPRNDKWRKLIREASTAWWEWKDDDRESRDHNDFVGDYIADRLKGDETDDR